MLAYQIRLAWLSLKRNPVLSLLVMGGIGLGIAVAMTFVTTYYLMSANPIPQKSDRLHYVQLDAWDPDRPWDDDNPDEPSDQLTYMDMSALLRNDIPTLQSGMYKTQLTVHPDIEGMRPFREVVRMCNSDFFSLFDTPFVFGSAWDKAADAGPEQVVVIGERLNQKLFGGENSVGRSLKIEDREFRVSGVLRHWDPLPKYYDPLNDAFEDAEFLFMPLGLGAAMEIRTAGNTSGWGGNAATYQALLQSEYTWVQLWVQLDTARQREEYEAFLMGYIQDQKKLGRFGRPPNYKLRNVMEWLKHRQVVPDEARALVIIALLFLLICSVNLIGILLGKFLARGPEVGVRRALGASRRWVFVQHLVECLLVGLIGGLFGLALSAIGLRLVDRLFDNRFEFALDARMFLMALALALLSSLIAGAYPAWRICRIQPGLHLKTQ